MRQKFYHINDDLLVKYLLGEASPAEIEAVEVWIETDAANRKHFEDFKKIWDESKSLALNTRVNEDAAWNRFKEKLQQPMPARPSVKRLQPMSWMRIAALFIVTIGLAYAAYRVLSPDKIENRIVSSKDAPLVDTLMDGSVVTLNKNASLHYPSKFSGKSRLVTLEGEAFFNVTANKEKPFIISVKDVSITVVGTSFNVKSKNGVTEVIVETGIVQVRKNSRVVELKPGESIRLLDGDSAMTKDKVTDKLYNYYQSREFVCDDTPLWKLVEVLNAAYDANIIIGNDELRNLKLTTTFNNESLDKILEVISLTFGIKVSKEADRIILKPNY